MNLLLPGQDGSPSTNRTIFFIGCLVCIGKLALSGMDLHLFKVPVFSGSDFGMAIAALGAVYSLDKHVGNMAAKDKE